MRKRLVIFFVILSSICFLSTNVMADQSLMDGLQVVMTSDKATYEVGENIAVTLAVTNTNSYSVHNVYVSLDTPDGYIVQNEMDSRLFATIHEGETVRVGITIAPFRLPATGDRSYPLFWLGLLLLSVVVLVFIYAYHRKRLKEILVIVLLLPCLSAVSHVIGSQAAAESAEKRIACSLTVHVDGRPLQLNGYVTYELSENESLQKMESSRSNIVAGMLTPVTFTVECIAQQAFPDKIGLYDNMGRLLAYMHPSVSEDADGTARVYSCDADLSSYQPGRHYFHAATEHATTSPISLYIYEPYSAALEKEFNQFVAGIDLINEQFTDEQGYIPYEDRNKAIEEVRLYAEEMLATGRIYYYEVGDGSICLKHRSGIAYVYCPRVEALLAGSGETKIMRIKTCLPYGALDKYKEVTKAARNLDQSIMDYSYNEDQDHMVTSDVTLDVIKSFSRNEIILWYGHGAGHFVHKEGSSYSGFLLPTDESFEIRQMIDQEFQEDVLENTVFCNGGTICINHTYIDKHCGDLSNSVFFIVTCWSAKCNCFADAFINKGAQAYIGFTEITPQAYAMNIFKTFFESSLKINPETKDYYTVVEAMRAAEEEHGKQCEGYWNMLHGYVRLEEPTSPKVYLKDDDDFRLQDLPSREPYLYTDTGTLTILMQDAENPSTRLSGEVRVSLIPVFGNSPSDLPYTGKLKIIERNDSDSQEHATKHLIPVGTYTATISCERYCSVTQIISIRPNQSTTLSLKLERLPAGSISGLVKRADNNVPVKGAGIKVLSLSMNNMIYSDTDGKYQVVDIPVGEAELRITAPGYITLDVFTEIRENETTFMESFLLVEGSDEISGIAAGRVLDSISGQALAGATLTLTPGWNNTKQSESVSTVQSDNNGNYQIKGYAGYYTAIVRCNGYADTVFNLYIQPDCISDHQNISMVPNVASSQYRIKLTWGENPNDLDSHVHGTLSNGNIFHTYFASKDAYDGSRHVCNLDVDDTTSYGPEIITLSVSGNQTYYYFVHRYAGSGAIASSDARVEVYQGDRLLRVFNVPTNLGTDDYWNVFAIQNGDLIVRNTITPGAELSYASASLFRLMRRSDDYVVFDLPTKRTK